MDGEMASTAPAGGGTEDELEVIDSGVLLAELRAQRLSRNAIIEELMSAGLTLDEATDAFDDDVPVRLARSGGEIRRLDPVPIPEPVAGIGGWLLLPAFQLVLSPLVLLADLYGALESIRALDRSEVVPVGPRRLLVTAVALDAALLALSAITLWFFFRKKRVAPRFYIALLVAAFVATGIAAYGAAGLAGLQDEHSQLVLGRAVAAAVWTAYFLRSERVKNTFIY